ncbi:MAG: glycoside-pentoside-hexuronide (GPH):cation symporter [Clostridiales bacterium]|nr:glycoside-pentoside-hexuronide (GPH):cation symporter [Clostridiales bacterium]
MSKKDENKSKNNIPRYLGYGLGAIGLDLSYGMFNQYLNKYLTDVLMLHSAFLLFLTAFSRVWDGINDPIMGSIVDRSNHKMGKYRPWILLGACLNGIVLSLLFNNIFGLQGVGLYVYIAIMYVLWGMTNTVADIPYWSMVPSFTSDPKERNLVATITRAFSGIGQGIIQIIGPILMTAVSITYDGNNKVYDSNSFRITSISCSFFLIVFALLCVSVTKENKRLSAPQSEKFSFSNSIKIIKSNDQLMIFMIFAMLSNTGWYLAAAAGSYFFDVVVGNVKMQSTFGLFGAVGSIIGLPAVLLLEKWFDKRKRYIIALTVEVIGFVFMGISGMLRQYTLLNIAYTFVSLGSAVMFVSQTVFLSDIVDYGEIKTGGRNESVTFSMKGFLQKMAYTMQTISLYALLWITGYVGDMHSGNSAQVHSAVSAMMYVIPPLFIIGSLIVFCKKYKLVGEYMDNITLKISEKIKKEKSILNESN